MKASESQVFMMAEKPMKRSVDMRGGEGLGSVMATAGTRNREAWTRAMAGMLILLALFGLYAAESVMLGGGA